MKSETRQYFQAGSFKQPQVGSAKSKWNQGLWLAIAALVAVMSGAGCAEKRNQKPQDQFNAAQYGHQYYVNPDSLCYSYETNERVDSSLCIRNGLIAPSLAGYEYRNGYCYYSGRIVNVGACPANTGYVNGQYYYGQQVGYGHQTGYRQSCVGPYIDVGSGTNRAIYCNGANCSGLTVRDGAGRTLLCL